MFNSINPSNGQVLATFDEISDQELDSRLDSAVKTQGSWCKTPLSERSKLLIAIAEVLDSQQERWAELMTLEVDFIPGLYDLIKQDIPTTSDVRESRFYTPGFYKLITETPGHLIAPKWYLNLPANIKSIADIAFGENTLIQILLAVAFTLMYLIFTTLIAAPFLKTYKRKLDSDSDEYTSKLWVSLQDREAWTRLFLVIIFVTATSITLAQGIIEYARAH